MMRMKIRRKKPPGRKAAVFPAAAGGVDGRRGEAMEKLKEFTDADLIARRDALNAAANTAKRLRQPHSPDRKTRHARHRQVRSRSAASRSTIEEPITVRTLSAALGVKTNDIQSRLMKSGIAAAINQTLDHEAAQAIALEFGIELQIAQKATLEETLVTGIRCRASAIPPTFSRGPPW